MSSFDLARYLERIGVDAVPDGAAGLALLQTAQLRRVTFENIDPLLGLEPRIDVGSVFRKIVTEGRGGYCFELNTLLGEALARLEFPARRRLARVRRPGESEGGPRSHLCWIAEADGRRWLVDAGFGGPGALGPLDVDRDDEQQRPNGTYRLRDDARTGERLLERRGAEGWVTLYGFDDAHVTDADLVAANHLSATWSEAPFPRHLMLNGYDGRTRFGVFDRTLTVETAEGSTRRSFADFDDFAATLTGAYRLPLDRSTLDRIWRKIDSRS